MPLTEEQQQCLADQRQQAAELARAPSWTAMEEGKRLVWCALLPIIAAYEQEIERLRAGANT